MTVPFFSYATSFSRMWPEIAARLDLILSSDVLTNGPLCRELEAAVRHFTGARHALCVGNGTDALILLLRAAGIGAGDEVIVPSFTFFASASSIAHAGATPVFADIEPESYSLDIGSVARAITPRTKAIMAVHLFTQMADMTALRRLADSHGITLIEDSAEGIGMWYGGVHAGLHGLGGVLSFFPTKTLGTFGDAGMVVTNDDSVASTIAELRDHGRRPGDATVAHRVGTNSKMDEIHAAILLTRLGQLPDEIRQRAVLAHAYDEGLRQLSSVVAIPRIAARQAATNPVFYVYLIETERRDDLNAHLAARGIGTEQYYPMPLHLQPCFAALDYREGVFPNAERACRRTLALPLYPDMGEASVRSVCGAIADFFEGKML